MIMGQILSILILVGTVDILDMNLALYIGSTYDQEYKEGR